MPIDPNDKRQLNLIPYGPGQGRGPGPREPYGKRAATILAELLGSEADCADPRDITGKTVIKLPLGDLMHLMQVVKAARGDGQAYDRILDRLEGKAAQTINLEKSKVEIKIDVHEI
jgi:hypothetical protein